MNEIKSWKLVIYGLSAFMYGMVMWCVYQVYLDTETDAAKEFRDAVTSRTLDATVERSGYAYTGNCEGTHRDDGGTGDSPCSAGTPPGPEVNELCSPFLHASFLLPEAEGGPARPLDPEAGEIMYLPMKLDDKVVLVAKDDTTFFVDNGKLDTSDLSGLVYRTSMAKNVLDPNRRAAAWGTTIEGKEIPGEAWVQVTLPVHQLRRLSARRCVNSYAPWMVVQFVAGGETYERCAYKMGTVSNSIVYDYADAVVPAPPTIKIWDVSYEHRCIAGYADQAELDKFVVKSGKTDHGLDPLMGFFGAIFVATAALFLWTAVSSAPSSKESQPAD